MSEGVEAVGADLNASPSGVISIQIVGKTSVVGLRRTNPKAPSEGIVDEAIGLIGTGKDTHEVIQIGQVGWG